MLKTEVLADKRETTDYTIAKIAYSASFEVVLAREDFGKSREAHNELCNRQLLTQIEILEREGNQFSLNIDNQSLILRIKSNMRASPASFVWEHCSSSKAGGRLGVMRLVEKDQHTPKSEFWKLIHPDAGHRGGYHEWAIPSGAPTKIPKRYRAALRGIHAAKVDALDQAEALPLYFKKAVLSNNLDLFMRTLEKANQICTEEAVQMMLAQNYSTDTKKPETLLHLAAANGHVPLINCLVRNVKSPQVFLKIKNKKGDTPAHIAAKNNREHAVRALALSGANLAIKNNKGLTVTAIRNSQKQPAEASSSNAPLPQHHQVSIATNSHFLSRPKHDPQFTYSRGADSSKAGQSSKTGTPSTTPRKPVNVAAQPRRANKADAKEKLQLSTRVVSHQVSTVATSGTGYKTARSSVAHSTSVMNKESNLTPATAQTSAQKLLCKPLPVSRGFFAKASPGQGRRFQAGTGAPKVSSTMPLSQAKLQKPAQQRTQQQAQQRAQQQPQQRIQQAQQRTQQQSQQRIQQAQQRAQQQAQQRAQQERARQAQQRAQQERARQAQQRAQQERARQAAQQRAQEQARQAAQQRAAQERARQAAQQRAQEQARQAAQQRAAQERARQAQLLRAQQLAREQARQAQLRAQQLAQQQAAQRAYRR